MGEAPVLARVVSAMTRAIRAMGYYDASHPVFELVTREAFAALSRSFRDRSVVTLGAGGRQLVVDADGDTLDDAPSADLAARMFNLSVIAIRIHEVARAGDLGRLLKLLAEGAEKVRAAGGARVLLEGEGVQGIDVLEVDFGALFAGQDADLSPLVDGDPIAKLALEAVLRFGKDDGAKGEALAINLDELSTPESLGEFLDELLDHAEPGVVSEAAEEWGHLSGDDVADHAAQAYLANQKHLSGSDLSGSARVLSDALVRLSPDARFALLRKLAGKDTIDSADQEQAVRRLGEQLRDERIVEAIAAALLDRSSDSDTVRAIGNLIRRIRPVEAERRRLLDQVDETMLSHQKPIDGVLWQQLQAQALEDRALGLLELQLAQRRHGLARAAQLRLRGRVPPVLGQDLLHTFDRLAVLRRTARALVVLAAQPGRLSAGVAGAIESTVLGLVEQDDEDTVLALLGSLVRRMDRGNGADHELAVLMKRLLAGERGAIWSAKLLERGIEGRMMGELILNALDGAGDRDYQEGLIERLARFDHRSILALGEQAADAEPIRVHHLVRAALRADAKVGLKVVRIALKNQSYKAKELAIKAVIEAPSADAISVLAQVAGWKGERHTQALLGGKSLEGARLHRLQLAAVGALGLSHSPVAVKPLFELLTQKRLFESREVEEIRLGAAQALLTNGTPEARRALEEGARHKKKGIRDACSRVLANRRG